MRVWIHHFSYQCDWHSPVLACVCSEGFWIAVVCAYVAECVLRKVLPKSDASCGGALLKTQFVLEKLLIVFLLSPPSESFDSTRIDDILSVPMKPTHSSVLALWFVLSYSILLTLLLLETSISESANSPANKFRHSVLATLSFVFILTLLPFLRQFCNTMSLEMSSIVTIQFCHVITKALRILLSSERPKEWKESFLSRCLMALGSFFYTLDSVLVVYFGFFIRGRVLAGVFISQIHLRSRQLVSTIS